MQYIVTEDSKSGYMFWEAFAELDYEQEYRIITSEGNEKKYIETVYNVFKVMKNNDKVLLAFDKASGVNTYALCNKMYRAAIKIKAKDKNIGIRYTIGYSLEETLICFLATGRFKVEDWVLEVASMIAKDIEGNYNWFEDTEIRKILIKHNVEMDNRETCATRLLAKASDKKGCKNIYAGKSKIGACWIGNKNIANNTTECVKCTGECKNLSFEVVEHRLKIRDRKRGIVW